MLIRLAISSSIVPLVLHTLAPTNDFVVPLGQTVIFDTTNGQSLIADNVLIDGTLRVIGTGPFRVHASGLVRVSGTIDVSGFDSHGVNTVNTTSIPEPGAPGAAAGGAGGTGNEFTTQSTPKGGDGFGGFNVAGFGGRGGETGWNAFSISVDDRRGAGGGGGALAVDQPVDPDPNSPLNRGLVAHTGYDSGPNALGAITGLAPARGGAIGPRAFTDGRRVNDFWGRKLDPVYGLIVGELNGPVAGSGGGAGGNASFTHGQPFPALPFDPSGDEKGSGGGGGGGVALISARRVEILGNGAIHVDGGDGGGGENTNFLNRVGGGSGGGSGGFLVVQAPSIDLSQAHSNCLTALGGRGGPGKANSFGVEGAGGDGGPGVIQLQVPGGAPTLIKLPGGASLDALSSPDAQVLLTNPSL